jgi:hypothetical protein
MLTSIGQATEVGISVPEKKYRNRNFCGVYEVKEGNNNVLSGHAFTQNVISEVA